MDSWLFGLIVLGVFSARILHPYVYNLLTEGSCTRSSRRRRRRKDNENDDDDDHKEAGIALLGGHRRRLDQVVTLECERLHNNVLNRNDPWTQHLRLCGMGITTTEVAALADALRDNTTVAWVDLSTNLMGNVGIQALASALAVNRTVKDLDLTATKMGPEGAAALGRALVQRWMHTFMHQGGNQDDEQATISTRTTTATTPTTTLLSLRLNHNKIGSEGAMAFANAWMEVSSCETATTSAPNGSRHTTPLGTAIPFRCLVPALVELQLDYNDIGDVGAAAMASLVMSFSTPLQALRIRENNITVKGIRNLAVALSHPNCRLKELYVGGNNLGDEGVQVLARAIAGRTSNESTADNETTPMPKEDTDLESGTADTATAFSSPRPCRSCLAVLDLSRCNMTNVGLQQMSFHFHEAIQQDGNVLSDLLLSENRLGDDGIVVFSQKVVSCSRTLRKVELWGNQMGNKGGRSIAAAIAESPSPFLETINVRFNRHLTDGNLLRGMDVLLQQKRQEAAAGVGTSTRNTTLPNGAAGGDGIFFFYQNTGP